MNIRTQITNKLSAVYLIIGFVAFLILGQILYLQNWKKEELEKDAKTVTFIDKPANRGDILSIDGRLLATSIPVYELRFDPTVQSLTDSLFYKNLDSLSYCLSNLFQDKTKEEYAKLIDSAREIKNSYLFLQEEISFKELQQVKKFPIFRRGKYKGGLIAEKRYNRKMPHNYLAIRTIGYVKDGNYEVGLEGYYDDILKGKNGFKLMQNIPGNTWREIYYKDEVEPIDGMDIITTIDVNIQDIVDIALRKQLIKHKAEWGTAVLMEVKTGEIRAICNLEMNKKDSTYRETYNYAVGTLYEPGSTFKLPAIIAALEKGGLTIDQIINTGNGIKKIGTFTIKDYKEGGFGKITVQQVFELSSNVGISIIVAKQFAENPDEFIDRLYSMSLNQKLGLKIDGEITPEIKYPSNRILWSPVSLMQMAQGYELKITPLQILSFFNAIANDGVLLRPMFVKAYKYQGKIVETFEPIILNSLICSEETIKIAQFLLEGAVERGTGKENIKSEKVSYHFRIRK